MYGSSRRRSENIRHPTTNLYTPASAAAPHATPRRQRTQGIPVTDFQAAQKNTTLIDFSRASTSDSPDSGSPENASQAPVVMPTNILDELDNAMSSVTQEAHPSGAARHPVPGLSPLSGLESNQLFFSQANAPRFPDLNSVALRQQATVPTLGVTPGIVKPHKTPNRSSLENITPPYNSMTAPVYTTQSANASVSTPSPVHGVRPAATASSKQASQASPAPQNQQAMNSVTKMRLTAEYLQSMTLQEDQLTKAIAAKTRNKQELDSELLHAYANTRTKVAKTKLYLQELQNNFARALQTAASTGKGSLGQQIQSTPPNRNHFGSTARDRKERIRSIAEREERAQEEQARRRAEQDQLRKQAIRRAELERLRLDEITKQKAFDAEKKRVMAAQQAELAAQRERLEAQRRHQAQLERTRIAKENRVAELQRIEMQKKKARLANTPGKDVVKALNPDYTTPFKGLVDVWQRLAPFHVFGAVDEDDVDVEGWGRKVEELRNEHDERAGNYRCRMVDLLSKWDKPREEPSITACPEALNCAEELFVSRILFEDEKASLDGSRKDFVSWREANRQT